VAIVERSRGVASAPVTWGVWERTTGRDDLVPPGQSRAYAAAARAAGDTVDLGEFLAADHFDVIEEADPAWTAVGDWLRELFF